MSTLTKNWTPNRKKEVVSMRFKFCIDLKGASAVSFGVLCLNADKSNLLKSFDMIIACGGIVLKKFSFMSLRNI